MGEKIPKMLRLDEVAESSGSCFVLTCLLEELEGVAP